jgi:hypothetical protein
VKAYNSFEANVALKIAGSLQAVASIRSHADNDTCGCLPNHWRVVLLVDGKGIVVKLKHDADVMLLFRKMLILEAFEMGNAWDQWYEFLCFRHCK